MNAGRRSRWLLVAVLIGLVLVSVVVAAPAFGGQSAGMKVVLGPCGKYKAAKLDAAVDLLERRIDNLGVEGASVSRRGSEIVVRLPGVVDRRAVRFLLFDELRLRAVLMAGLPAERDSPPVATSGPPTTTVGVRPDTSTAGCGRSDVGSTSQGSTDPAARAAVASCNANAVATLPTIPTTAPEDDQRTECVVLPARGGKSAPRYYLGPAELTGSGVDRAVPEFLAGQGWTVEVRLTHSGSSKWDAFAQGQFHKPIAITIGGFVLSEPVIQPADRSFRSFGGTMQISGDFSQRKAEELAQLINYGAAAPALFRVKQATVTPHR